MLKDTVFYSKKTLNCRGRMVDLSLPAIMGIINVTPDSFFKNSRYALEAELLGRVEAFLEQGATFIDIGGYSSRPGADDVPEEEELKRVLPAINSIIKKFPEALISIDTFRSVVARQAVDTGASLINDISGGELDKDMFTTVRDCNVPYIMMHMKGTPKTMHTLNSYEDIFKEILKYFQEKTATLTELGVKDLVLDPGIGFAKGIEQNYDILRNLNYFKMLNLPILIGVSRKSLVYKKLGISAEESLNGTTVLNTIALLNGADILRVHDVKEAVEAVKLVKAVYH